MSKPRTAALLLCSLLFTNLPARSQRPSPAPQTPPSPTTAQTTAPQPTPTPGVAERIRDEGLNRSQVMQTLSYLTDVIGPRLTISPFA